jgi:hypothetical protein
VLRAAERELARSSSPAAVVPIDGPPSYPALLGAADVLIVTADSVSMISEAVATGKPVGLVPIRRTWRGALLMALLDWLKPGCRVFPRDLRFFWREIERHGYVGTVDHPRNSLAPDLAALVIKRVRQLFESPVEPATNDRDYARSAQLSPP